jgi:hypothetical protein
MTVPFVRESGLRHNQETTVTVPGAQTNRRGDAGPVRALPHRPEVEGRRQAVS